MTRICLSPLIFFVLQIGFAQQDPLQTPEWKKFFNEKTYEKHALRFSDETFWDINDSYIAYQEYPVLLIYSDGTSRVIQWSFEGLDKLILKKEAFTATDFVRYEKENLTYIVFDSVLYKNPRVGNMIAGDFMIVYKKGPISLYREYYTSPITRDNIESVLTPYYLSEMVKNFYLGSRRKKLVKLVEDFPDLQQKIKDGANGYEEQDEDMLRIAEEYNLWTKENYPYRYADHAVFMWQEVEY